MTTQRPYRAFAAVAMLLLIVGCGGDGESRSGEASGTGFPVSTSTSTTEDTLESEEEPDVPEETFPRLKETLDSLPAGDAAEPGEAIASQLGDTSTYTMHDFLSFVLTDIDTFWSSVWRNAGLTEPFVYVDFPAPGVSMQSSCETDGFTDDSAAFYCGPDDQIVFSQALATRVWEGSIRTNNDPLSQYSSGDFSVAYVMAHEYAHSLQAELDIIPDAPGETRLYPVYKTELHADCWSGIWANSAYYRNLLDPGDVEEGIRTALDIGDYDFANAKHHGTPAERTEALMVGYNSGVPQDCDPYLLNDY